MTKKTILVVDDEQPMVELARMILERAGYRVIDAVNGRDGLRKALEMKPHLILMDLMMPVLNGGDAFRQLIQNSQYQKIRETPVIILSARSLHESERKQLFALGLAACLIKPFGHRELVNVIDNVFLRFELNLDGRRLEWELRDSFEEAIKLLGFVACPELKKHLGPWAFLSLTEKVCGKLGIATADLPDIKLAALLRGIGRVGISKEAQTSGGSDQDVIVRGHQHAHYGQQAMNGIESLAAARELVSYHHENFDGSGHPMGLKGEKIPMGSRIVAVLDAFEVLTSDLCNNLDPREAVRRLRAGKNRQFDPVVVDALAECVGFGESTLAKTTQT